MAVRNWFLCRLDSLAVSFPTKAPQVQFLFLFLRSKSALSFIIIHTAHPYNTNQTDMAFALLNRGSLWRPPTLLFSLPASDKRSCQAGKQCSPRLRWRFPCWCGDEATPSVCRRPPPRISEIAGWLTSISTDDKVNISLGCKVKTGFLRGDLCLDK